MKLRPFSIRALLLLIFLIGVALGVLRARSRRFRVIADEHHAGTGGVRVGSTIQRMWIADRRQRPIPPEESDRFGREVLWHRAMYDQYQWAADHPWSPVPADPRLDDFLPH